MEVRRRWITGYIHEQLDVQRFQILNPETQIRGIGDLEGAHLSDSSANPQKNAHLRATRTPLGSLSSLPPEIRRMIYAEVFCSGSIALLRTSRSVYIDAESIIPTAGEHRIRILSDYDIESWAPTQYTIDRAQNLTIRVSFADRVVYDIDVQRHMARITGDLKTWQPRTRCRVFIESAGQLSPYFLGTRSPLHLHYMSGFEIVEVIFDFSQSSSHYEMTPASADLMNEKQQQTSICERFKDGVGMRLGEPTLDYKFNQWRLLYHPRQAQDI